MSKDEDEDELKHRIVYGSAASPNYYGDIVRGLFVAADVIILLTMPFFYSRLPMPLMIPVAGVIISGLAAGFTSARFRWSMALDMVIATAALALLEYSTIMDYWSNTTNPIFLFVTQILTLLYFFALYYSVQTLRRWIK